MREALSTALEMVGDPVLIYCTGSGEIVAANRAACRLSQLPRRQLVGQSVHAWGVQQFGSDFASGPPECTVETTTGPAPSRLVSARDGQRYAVEIRALAPNKQYDALAVLVLRSHSQGAAAVRVVANRSDSLTGLPDRETLSLCAASIEAREQSRDHWCALYFLDVDDFKSVNDRFGHLTGDQVLRAVANRLTGCVRPNDIVVRYGGDEFVVFVGNIEQPNEADRIASRIATALAPPVEVPGLRIELSVSVGVALARQGGLDLESLLDNADRSMYRAKARRRGRKPR